MPVCDGTMTGTTGQGKKITALNISVWNVEGSSANALLHDAGAKSGNAKWAPSWTPVIANGKNVYIGSSKAGAPFMTGFAMNVGKGNVCHTAKMRNGGWGPQYCKSSRPTTCSSAPPTTGTGSRRSSSRSEPRPAAVARSARALRFRWNRRALYVAVRTGPAGVGARSVRRGGVCPGPVRLPAARRPAPPPYTAWARAGGGTGAGPSSAGARRSGRHPWGPRPPGSRPPSTGLRTPRPCSGRRPASGRRSRRCRRGAAGRRDRVRAGPPRRTGRSGGPPRWETAAADPPGFGGDVAQQAEGGAARRDRLLDPAFQQVQGRCRAGARGLRRARCTRAFGSGRSARRSRSRPRSTVPSPVGCEHARSVSRGCGAGTRRPMILSLAPGAAASSARLSRWEARGRRRRR